jgi:hypothetical protein
MEDCSEPIDGDQLQGEGGILTIKPLALSSQLLVPSREEEAAGRAAYEAFNEEMKPWLPYPANWPDQAVAVKRGWIAAAKAARGASS